MLMYPLVDATQTKARRIAALILLLGFFGSIALSVVGWIAFRKATTS
jgi:hypothetical protein